MSKMESTPGEARLGETWDIQRKVRALMVRISVLVGRVDGGSRGTTGVRADHHWEPLGNPEGGGDPHDRPRTLNLDDPEVKLR